MSTDEKSDRLDTWAMVEVMGHKRFAGRVSEHTIGSTAFVRVDVPEVVSDDQLVLPAFTKLFGASSIYCISPCTEETARAFAAQMRTEAFSRYEAPRLPHNAATATDERDDDEEDWDEPC